jgi:hypothetical protein
MTKEDVRAALVARLGELMHPKYHPHPERYEGQMRAVAKELWPHRQHFPAFWHPIIATWSKA